MSPQDVIERLNAILPGLPLILLVPVLLMLMYITLLWIRARSTVDRQITTLDRQVVEEAKLAAEQTGQYPATNTTFWNEHFNRQQQYILVNLRQNQGVFLLAISMIVFGLALICFGLVQDFLFSRPGDTDTIWNGSWAAIIAGLISQFFAGTILVVFKSVFQQTTDYYKSVERMASIGIAMNMLDTLPTGDSELKSRILANIARVVLDRQLGQPGASSAPDKQGKH